MTTPATSDQFLETQAHKAGLSLALANFPEDVAAAAAIAASASAALQPPENPRAEPWPPMRAS